jgi:hypothetical protein
MWNGLPGGLDRLWRVADAIGKNWSLLFHAINGVREVFFHISSFKIFWNVRSKNGPRVLISKGETRNVLLFPRKIMHFGEREEHLSANDLQEEQKATNT